MRRLVVALAVLGAATVATPAPAATVKVITSLGVGASAFNPDNSGFYVFPCSVYNEETVGGSTITYNFCNVSVFNGIGGSAFGSGTLTMNFDPLLLTGTIKGTIGSIVVDLTYVASEVSTSPPPYASAELVPTPPQQATVQASITRNGRINGTVTSPQTGTVTGTNGGANVFRYNATQVKA